MFTIIMTFVGLLVFILTLPVSGFAKAFKRFLLFAITGIVLDALMFLIVGTVVFTFN